MEHLEGGERSMEPILPQAREGSMEMLLFGDKELVCFVLIEFFYFIYFFFVFDFFFFFFFFFFCFFLFREERKSIVLLWI